ncbi:MAG: oligosaccharide flippase family protein, partial [Nitrospiraceae bacterium]|nr:oligosaccharide flippase family protein [Nitrospiraceae bacterium]
MPKGLNAHLKTAVKGSTLILLGIAISNLLWFLIKILIIRNTTKIEFGIYSLALTVFGVLTTIAPLGIPSGVPRFISLYRGEGKEDEARLISRAGVQISVFLGVLAFVMLYFFSDVIARDVFYTPQLAGPL